MSRSHIGPLVVFALASLGLARPASADPPYPDALAPGQLRGVSYRQDEPWPMGYWEYLPSSYVGAAADERWPLLVFIGGIGQSDEFGQCPGDADTCLEADCPFSGLCRATRRGPMRLMRQNQWDDTQRNYIFVSPQHHVPALSTQPWDPDELDAFFEYVIENYPIDTRRMYLVGMSQGGRGVLQYAEAYPRRFTAIAPTPGGAVSQDVTCRIRDTALWAFHGEDDTDANLGTGVFDPCWIARRVHMANHPENYSQFPACVQRTGQDFPASRITMFYDEGHEVWIPANDPINIGFATDSWETAQDCFGVPVSYHPYRSNLDADGIYTWFDSLDRPHVQAPDDAMLLSSSTMLTATIVDDDPVIWSWTQTAGPAATLAQMGGASLVVTNLQADQLYTFMVRVVDSDGQWDEDTVEVSTGTELSGTTGGSVTGGSDGSTGGDATTGDPSGSTSNGVDPSGTTGSDTTTGNDSTTGSDPTTGGNSTTGSDTTPGDSGPGGGTTTAPPHETSPSWTAGADDDEPGDPATDAGCSCTTRSDPAGKLAWFGLLLVGLVRRRSN